MIGDTISYGGIDFTLIGINDALNNLRTIMLYNTVRNNIEMQNKMHLERVGIWQMRREPRLYWLPIIRWFQTAVKLSIIIMKHAYFITKY